MKATIPYHMRSNNTSMPPETLTEEEKIAKPKGGLGSNTGMGFHPRNDLHQC